jgi:co-chaperonin GroES (HSP10)
MAKTMEHGTGFEVYFQINFDGEEHLIMREEDILGVIEK